VGTIEAVGFSGDMKVGVTLSLVLEVHFHPLTFAHIP
jgi:hypothetical protein